MRTKNISPYRETCTFRYDKKILFKGYVDKEGFYVGLTIIYHRNNVLQSIGYYDDVKRNIFTTRRIGLWKEYDKTGTLNKEQIYIK